MAPLDAARAELARAEELAEQIVNAAWLAFGRAIREARLNGMKQADIARHFKWEAEHVRRIQEDADVADGLKRPPARKTRQVEQSDELRRISELLELQIYDPSKRSRPEPSES